MVTLAREGRRPGSARPRVEMLGVFGSGKTTLAYRLAPAVGVLLAESHDDNPFWGDDHAVSVAGPVAYELSFLVQHAHLASRSVARGGDGVGLCDWSFASDLLWASLRLGDELAVFAAVQAAVTARVGPPIGYLYLRQPEDVIASRLTERGIEAEAPLLDAIPGAIASLDVLASELPGDHVLVVRDDTPPEVVSGRIDSWGNRRSGG